MKKLNKNDAEAVSSVLGDAAVLCGEEEYDEEGRHVVASVEQNTMIAIARCLQAIAIMMRSDRE
jgi:hypothetical protein